MFKSYPHLERFGTDLVDNINVGVCHIFPKIDGTNASVWWEEKGMQCGSRNRQLTVEQDNAGFCRWALNNPDLLSLTEDHPTYRFYGEWLIPHSLKTYREEAWKKFYVFDVYDTTTEKFLPYEEYKAILQPRGVGYIPCMAVITNPNYEVLKECTEQNTFLIEDGKGVGEGIVIKRYDFVNSHNHTTWAKLITNQFKEKHIEAMGATHIMVDVLEEQIAQEYVTIHTIDKIVAKIRVEKGDFTAREIPMLLGLAWYEFITEELFNALKKHKNPKIDFRQLQQQVIRQVKACKPELFGK